MSISQDIPRPTESVAPPSSEENSPTVFTIGLSTRSLDEFVTLLREFEVARVVDFRTAAGSGRNPQYGKGALNQSLPKHDIAYERLKELGGFRKTTDDSPNK